MVVFQYLIQRHAILIMILKKLLNFLELTAKGDPAEVLEIKHEYSSSVGAGGGGSTSSDITSLL